MAEQTISDGGNPGATIEGLETETEADRQVRLMEKLPDISRQSRTITYYVVLALLLVLTSTFVILSFIKLNEVQSQIALKPDSRAATYVLGDLTTSDDEIDKEVLRAHVLLESDVMLVRHQRAATGLITRTWLEFMCLIFGSILISIGSAFVFARIASPQVNRAEVAFGGFKGSMLTASPGLVLVLLGTVLVILPNVGLGRPISINDTGTYVAKPPILPMGYQRFTVSSAGTGNQASIVTTPEQLEAAIKARCEINPDHQACKGAE